jgi:hypothetical protein
LPAALFRELSPEHQEVMWEIFHRWRDDLVSLIERGFAAGKVRPLDPMLMLPVMSICSGMPIDAVPVENGFSDDVARFLFRGIAPADGS